LSQLYAQYRRQVFPSYCAQPERTKPRLWRRLAIRTLEEQCDIGDFMALCFSKFGARPYIEQLISDAAFTGIKDRKLAQEKRIRCELTLFAAKLQRRWHVSKDLKSSLNELAGELSDLFVWCVAASNNLTNMEAMYRNKALQQASNPLYKHVYAEAFPEMLARLD
jgi:hypothetical protein